MRNPSVVPLYRVAIEHCSMFVYCINKDQTLEENFTLP